MKAKESIGADGYAIKEDKKLNTEADMTPLKLLEGQKTVLFLVRHGQSEGNAKREFLGHTDKDLSPLGYKQAERTSEFMLSEHIDVIYSSDLKRAYNTAVPHAKPRGLEVIPELGLREIFAGEWEGMRVDDILKNYSTGFIDGWTANFGTYTIPGGESTRDAGKRFFTAVMEIAKANEGSRILIAAHAAVIRSFWGIINGISPEELADAFPYPKNASVSVVYFDGDRLLPGEYSHADHLLDLE